jgi:hypothetical protein
MRLTTLALCVTTTACFTQDLPTGPHVAPQPIAKPALSVAVDPGSPMLVRGVVASDSGVPLLGANITIDAINASVGTDRTGAFIIKARREGTFSLRVRAIGYAPVSQIVTISAGSGLWINATLKADRWQSACSMVVGPNGIALRAPEP